MRREAFPDLRPLSDEECRHYRDELRAGRYAALADAEGFDQICFALEALGLRLLGKQGDLGKYEDGIGFYARLSPVLNDLAKTHPSGFKPFEALYETVRKARNDNMHLGAYARHATDAAIELCIGLEEALMVGVRPLVGHVMVKLPITVEPWQPIAHARQLMLMHSFSFLPIRHQQAWFLLSELALAQFLNGTQKERAKRLGLTIEDAMGHTPDLELMPVAPDRLLTVKTAVDEVLCAARVVDGPTLWLVVDEVREGNLVGVLSPFELM
ncbi:MAG: hypothetical protein WA955_06355 [Diaphorobacter nitroreducens]|uniref:CBS domain-containing protein n=1 Tax=Diaphorobacter TaxID=238749 RepID=UPI0011E4CF70|nr:MULTISPECIES: CBS domain-containing protein [Diaphorobacter]